MRSWTSVVFATLLLTLVTLRPAVNAQTTDPSSSDSTASRTGQEQTSNPVISKPDSPSQPKAEQETGAAADKGKWRLRPGTVSVGAGYGNFTGPYFYPYGRYAFYPGDVVYGSLWYPIWGAYPYYGPGYFGYNNGRGEVRLSTEPKSAEVYIDGGYAGTADKLKILWLDPGAYDLTVSAKDRTSFHQRLYVLSGKSLKISAKLESDAAQERP
jgi:hypothetical protein